MALVCHGMAERFARGGRLIAFGASAADWSDVRHVAVEFVHPVIVGKRALPALGIAPERVPLLAEADDIAIAFGSGPEVEAAVAAARRGGLPERGVRPRRRRVGVRAGGRRRVRRPGAGRDALPRALGARARVLRAPRPAHRPRRRAGARHGRVELPLSVPGRARARSRRRARGRARLRAGQGGGGQRPARADARGGPRGARRRCPRAARLLRRRRPAARPRQRGLGDRRDGRGRRLLRAAGRPRLAGAAGARPHGGPRDPDRDRQRHRDRGDLRAPDHRPRAPGRRAAGALHERRLGQRARRPGRGAAARRGDRGDGRLRRRARSSPRRSPTT